MIVVADTTPLNYLILTGYAHVIPRQFDLVLIPGTVQAELLNKNAPEVVRRFIFNRPTWLEVREATEMHLPQLQKLDPGEREAIQLALQLGVELVLIDEIKGRNCRKGVRSARTGDTRNARTGGIAGAM